MTIVIGKLNEVHICIAIYVCVCYIRIRCSQAFLDLVCRSRWEQRFFFSSLWLSWFHHIFCVHKDSPANVTAYDCMNVLVRIVWVCICASVEFANNPDRKVSKHAEKQRKENKKRSHSSVIHHFVSPCIFGCHVPWHNQNSFRRSDINVLSVALARKQFLCLSLDFTVWTSPLSWKALVFRV